MSEESAIERSRPDGLLTRRQFLVTASASAAGAVVFTGCQTVPDHEFAAQSRVRIAEDTLSAYENWYATTCRQCGAGCGVLVRVIEGRAKKIEGNPDHPVNRGKLCARGQAAVQEQYHPDRIQGPLHGSGERGSGVYTAIGWNEALNDLMGRLRPIQQQGRGSQVVVLTEPLRGHRALVVQQFTRALGALWLTFDATGEAPLREATSRMFGQDLLPEFDIQNARYVLSFGADFLSTWLSPVHYGVAYGVFRQGNYRPGQFAPKSPNQRGYLVQVEPRFSATAANADEWVPLRPGAEGLLALGMAQVIVSEGLGDREAAASFDTRSLDDFRPERIAQDTGLPEARIRQLARDFATRRPSVALGGGSASAQTNGTDTMAAVMALNVLVGAVGREGGVRLNRPSSIEGLSARPSARLAEWTDLASRMRAGQVSAVLVHGLNPAHSLPSALSFGDALRSVPFVASFSSFMDETTSMADLILPSHLQLEDWGDDVPDPAPGLETLTIQQPTLTPLYDTRGFWDVLLTVGDELGGTVRAALPWQTFKDTLRQGARALQQQRQGSIVEADFERFWVRLLQQGGWWDERGAPPAAGAPNVRTVASAFQRARFAGSENEYPFNLLVYPHNSLGAGETAHLPWLQATPDPVTSAVWQTWVDVNPGVAQQMGLREGDIVSIESPQGKIEAPVYVNPAASPHVLSIPLGQGHRVYGRWAEGRGVNPMDLVAPLEDQAAGSLAYGATRVRMSKTGRRRALPKFEGSVPAFPNPGHEVAKVTRGG